MPVYLESTWFKTCYLYYTVRKNLTDDKRSQPSRLKHLGKETETVVVEEDEVAFFELFSHHILVVPLLHLFLVGARILASM